MNTPTNKRADPSTLKAFDVHIRTTTSGRAAFLGEFVAQTPTGAIVQAAHSLARGRVTVFSVTATIKGE